MLVKRGHVLELLGTEKEEFYEQFASLRDHLLASDAVISDTSSLDQTSGLQLAYSIESGKPVLILHYTKADIVKPDLTKVKNKNISVMEYSDLLELEEAVGTFIQKVQDTLDAKLFMIIPPDVNKYLDWVATHTKFSKSDIVRTAVLDVAQKDKDYQAFLKKFGYSNE
jgi:hypothetical protein